MADKNQAQTPEQKTADINSIGKKIIIAGLTGIIVTSIGTGVLYRTSPAARIGTRAEKLAEEIKNPAIKSESYSALLNQEADALISEAKLLEKEYSIKDIKKDFQRKSNGLALLNNLSYGAGILGIILYDYKPKKKKEE